MKPLKLVIAALTTFVLVFVLIPAVSVTTGIGIQTPQAAIEISGGYGASYSGANLSECSGGNCGPVQGASPSGSYDPNRFVYLETCQGQDTCAKTASATSVGFGRVCYGGNLYFNGIRVANGPNTSINYLRVVGNATGDTGAAAMRTAIQSNPARTIQRYGTMSDGTPTSWYYTGCSYSLTAGYSYYNQTQTCGLDTSRTFPYPVGAYLVVYRTYTGVNVNVNGTTYYSYTERFEGGGCLYLSPSTPPREIIRGSAICYWNVTYSTAYSTNYGAIRTGGSPTKPALIRVPDTSRQPTVTYNAVREASLNYCSGITINAALDLAGEPYGYYRLQANYNYQNYSRVIWDPTWTGREIVIDWRGTGIQSGSLANYGAYSCQVNGGRVSVGAYNTLPAGVDFSEARCSPNTWECTVSANPQINGTDQPTTVMRDGELVPLQLGQVSVSGGGIRDVDTGSTTTIAGENSSYQLTVNSGSTPFRGSNANASNQYFALWNQNTTTRENFNTWTKDPNGNRNKYLNYYWSSDNGTDWSLSYEARIDEAEFLVPVVNSSDGGVFLDWRTDENISCGVQSSNDVTVIRSVNSDG